MLCGKLGEGWSGCCLRLLGDPGWVPSFDTGFLNGWAHTWRYHVSLPRCLLNTAAWLLVRLLVVSFVPPVTG